MKLPRETRFLPKDTELNWIEWNGGKNPIKEGQEFSVKFRNHKGFTDQFGEDIHVDGYEISHLIRWNHTDPNDDFFDYERDIVAYAIVES